MTKALYAAGLLAALSTSPAFAGEATCGSKATPGAYPSFCAIPAIPTDVRSAEAFKSAVVDTRVTGRRVVRETGPDTFGLRIGDAESFSAAARAEAAPPPPIGAPVLGGATPADTAAFLAEARRQVTPPARPRRIAHPEAPTLP